MTPLVLDREEYVEQEYFFRVYRERLQQNVPSQEILQTIQQEILASTRLPIAVDFLRTEILHSGRISEGMARLSHYFNPFQAFVIGCAEDDESRFEQITALLILEREAHYRAHNAVPAGLFVYQFECIARNRMGYNDGLLAMSRDPLYDARWKHWILELRRNLGASELAEIVYRASSHFQRRRRSASAPAGTRELPASSPSKQNSGIEGELTVDAVGQQIAGRPDAGRPDAAETGIAATDVTLFGDQEGRIARANIGRDPLYFFAALQRQLDYPAVPRSVKLRDDERLPGFLEARLMKIEQRIKLLEMEQKGGIDLNRFYGRLTDAESQRPAFTDDVPDLS